MKPHEFLANAIVVQAAKDYKRALVKQKRLPDSRKVNASVKSLEKFFRSPWYDMLTTVDGSYLIDKIRETVNR